MFSISKSDSVIARSFLPEHFTSSNELHRELFLAGFLERIKNDYMIMSYLNGDIDVGDGF